jgi:hypothetical protein
MELDYLVSYDRQNPTAWVTFPTPLGGTSSGPLPITDAAVLAKVEELHALIATTCNLARKPVAANG